MNTTDSGKIVLMRSSALWVFLSSSQHAAERPLFQPPEDLCPPVNGAVPQAEQEKRRKKRVLGRPQTPAGEDPCTLLGKGYALNAHANGRTQGARPSWDGVPTLEDFYIAFRSINPDSLAVIDQLGGILYVYYCW
jgi:hypothetical protein